MANKVKRSKKKVSGSGLRIDYMYPRITRNRETKKISPRYGTLHPVYPGISRIWYIPPKPRVWI